MAEQAGALPVEHHRTAARRIALLVGQRRRDAVAHHGVGARRLLGAGALLRGGGRSADGGEQDERGEDPCARQPNTSVVIVLNQPLAKLASSARTSRDASALLTPPEPSISVSTPFTGRYTPATWMP